MDQGNDTENLEQAFSLADPKKLDSYLESGLYVKCAPTTFVVLHVKLVVYGNDDHCCIKHLPTNDSILLECSWLLLHMRK